MARSHLCTVFFSFSLLTAVAGASGLLSAAEYSHRIWRTQDGLPQSEIRAIAQTPDGYLWIGTSGGLARFDGVRFVVFDRSNTPAFRDDSILTLFTARDKSLWIGTEGGGLVHLRDGKFQGFGAKEGLTNLFVRSIQQDNNGNVWIGTDRGFFKFGANRLVRIDVGTSLSIASVSAMALAPDGILWLAGPSGLLKEQLGKISRYPFQASVRSVYASRDGTVWFATAIGLRILKPGATTLSTPAGRLGETDARQIYQNSDGDLWVGTVGNGIFRIRKDEITAYREEDFLPDNTVLSFFQDNEGNLWVGTQDGLLRLSKTVVTTLTTRNGLAASNVSTVYRDPKNRLLITTVTGKLLQIEGEQAQPYLPPGLAADVQASSVFEDSRGTLWIGTLNNGIARIEAGKATFYTKKDGLRNEQIRQFQEDSTGEIWIATGSGLIRWGGGNFQTYYLEDGLAYGSVRNILELHQGPNRGDLLIGTDGGLNRMRDRKIVNDPDFARLAGEKIWSMLELADGSVWLGTRGGGLFRLKDKKLSRLRMREGLPSNSIYQILDDRKGRLWMSSPAGIFSAAINDLDATAAGRPDVLSVMSYGTADGLESAAMKGGIQTAGCRSAAGDLWFPSVKGAVRIDPRQLRTSYAPSPIIESILADDSAIPLTSPVNIPAGRARLQIDYTACNLRSPEQVTFKYKLEGFDQEWTAASRRRVAYYTNLPPGNYRFRVVALESTANDNSPEASISFRWEPHYYQTTWFYILCVLFGGLAVIFSLRLYAMQTKARYAMLLAERTRLAREMHDTVIQGCVGVSTLLEAAGSMEHSGDEQARQLVDQARTQVRLTLEEARQAVWDLRHTSLHGGLAESLTDMARQLGADNRIDVQVQVSGPATSVEQKADKDLLLIAREAIRNAMSHGHSQHIQVSLCFERSKFERSKFERSKVKLEISDDGSGFDPGSAHGLEEGHYGILGMRERVEQLGGSFDVQSAPGKGAKVTVSVPYHD